MSKHKNHNYTNYKQYSSEAIVRYDKNEQPIDVSEESEVFEVIPPSGDGIEVSSKEPEIEEPKIPPEEKSEKLDVPMNIVLKTNLFIRETPYGDKVQKDELDRIIASKVIKDGDGWAIVPKETKTEVYDMMVHEDGSIWYATRFGYLLGKTKSGKVYVE